MTDMMQFPDSVDEFMEKYKIIDTEQVYTNGAELVPIFRMRQWFERKSEQRWIPVTERLPGYGEDVLLTVGAYCAVGYLSPTNDEERSEWYFSGWYHPMSDVTAWMPLPGPWKGGEA